MALNLTMQGAFAIHGLVKLHCKPEGCVCFILKVWDSLCQKLSYICLLSVLLCWSQGSLADSADLGRVK